MWENSEARLTRSKANFDIFPIFSLVTPCNNVNQMFSNILQTKARYIQAVVVTYFIRDGLQ